VVLGFHERGSHRVVAVARCPVLDDRLVALLPALQALLAGILPPGGKASVTLTALAGGVDLVLRLDKALDLQARESLAAFAQEEDLARLSVDLGDGVEPLAVRRPPTALFAGIAVTPPPGGFLQASAKAEALMIARVCDALAGCKRVADLFAGCGAFALPLAQAGVRVAALDSDSPALDALRAGARKAGLTTLTAEARDLMAMPLRGPELAGLDGLVFDPPRAGAKAQCTALAEASPGQRPRTIVAVSCNPASFSRDAALLRAGGYALESVIPLDQFLWSWHVELLAIFRDAGGSD